MNAVNSKSYEVSLETSAGLERRMTVRVPTAEIERAIAARLAQVGKTAKLKGFRPGKVPQKVVRQYYGGQVRDEVMTDVIRTTYSRAIAEQKLNPAGGPRIEPLAGADAGGHFAYRATFEVYPEIALQPLGELAVEVPSVAIEDGDLDAMIEKLRGQRATWKAVERKAAEGDRVGVDFAGTVDGEPFEGGQGKNISIVVGSGQVLQDFDRALRGTQSRREHDRDGLVPAGLSDEQPRRQDGGVRDQRAARRRAAAAGARRRVRRELSASPAVQVPCAAKCATTWSASSRNGCAPRPRRACSTR